MTTSSGRVSGARRATVLRYGGSLWVSGYWSDTTVSIELRPVRRVAGRVLLLGPSFGGGRSIAVNLGPNGSLEVFANELADWIETPALSSRRAEQAWPAVVRAIVADLADGMIEGIPA